MAVSGNQFTRLGASISGVGKKLVILAKEEAVIVESVNSGSMLASQLVRRSMNRFRRR